MTTTPLTTETAIRTSLDTTEIPIQFPATDPVPARGVADTFPHVPWVQTRHRDGNQRLLIAVATFGGFVVAASAAALIVAGALGGLS